MITTSAQLGESQSQSAKVHLVGAGGAGVFALLSLLKELGYDVSGCDQCAGPWVEWARSRGIQVSTSHGSRHLPEGCDYVVYSAAVPNDHPELNDARARGIQVLKYAEFLGRLLDTRVGIAVAGTHGKTTTSSWVAHLLQVGGLQPSFVIGGEVLAEGCASRAGRGDHLVVEACEYDDSFLNLRPKLAAITNLECDHLDYFKTEERMLASFASFVSQVPSEGALVLGGNVPDAVLAQATAGTAIRRLGDSRKARVHPVRLGVDGGYRTLRLSIDGVLTERVKLGLAGAHNLENALVAASLAVEAGVDAASLLEGLETFGGVGRRLENVGDIGGVTLIEDYAHHPTEVRAAAMTLRDLYPSNRLVALFQPHQVSRTDAFLDDFAKELAQFDRVLLADIFSVREDLEETRPETEHRLIDAIHERGGSAAPIGCGEEAAHRAAEHVDAGDVLVIMGAGDVNRLTPVLKEALAVAV